MMTAKMLTISRINFFRNFIIQRIYPTSYSSSANNVPRRLLYEGKYLFKVSNTSFMQIKRHKYKKTQEIDKDPEYYSESDSDEEANDTDPKLKKYRMPSLRMDSVLKSGLGISRSKVDTIFYEDRILLNGRKVSKKSVKLDIGDQIDVLRDNEENSAISRVVIVSAELNDNEDGYIVKLKRLKSNEVDSSDV